VKLKAWPGPGHGRQVPKVLLQGIHHRLAHQPQVLVFKGIEGTELLRQLGILQGVGRPMSKVVGVFHRRVAQRQPGLNQVIEKHGFVYFT